MKNSATRIFLVTTALILSGAIAAFGNPRQIRDTEWHLIEANGRAITLTLAAIDFNQNATRFTGNTGCNQMSGTVSVKGQNIDVSSVVTTKRACRISPRNVEEGEFLRALNQAKTYRVNGDILRLNDRRGRAVLKFKKADGRDDDHDDDREVRLEDRKWILEQIKNRQTFAPIEGAFLNFDARKGSAGGNTSCNAFGGSYSVRGERISVTEIISTMRACEEGNKMQVEREMLQGLRVANRFEIDGNRLRIYRNNELLLTFRGEKK